jgi:hypothetical protein
MSALPVYQIQLVAVPKKLHCMSFFELWLLVTPLIISHLKVVSSNHGHGEGPLDKTLYRKVFQTVATDRWFSQGILVSSTNKTDIHDRPNGNTKKDKQRSTKHCP